jgi:hypothetical protein
MEESYHPFRKMSNAEECEIYPFNKLAALELDINHSCNSKKLSVCYKETARQISVGEVCELEPIAAKLICDPLNMVQEKNPPPNRGVLVLAASFATAVTAGVSDGWGYVPRHGEIGIFETLRQIIPEVLAPLP